MATIIDALLVTLGLDSSKFNTGSASARKSMSQLQLATHQLNTQFETVTKTMTGGIRNIRTQLLEFYALLVAGRGFKQMVADVLQGDRATYLLARSLGTSTDTLAAWQVAAQRAGGTAEGLAGTFAKITSAISESVITGHSNALQAFVNAGVEVSDRATGQALSQEQILLNTQKRIQEMHMSRPMAQAWFGETIDPGTMNMLFQSREELQRNLASAREHGVPTDEDGKRAQRLMNDLANIRQTIDDITRNIIREFGPDIEKGLKALDDWLVKEKPEIIKLLHEFVEGLKGFDWAGLFGEFQQFITNVENVVKALGGWQQATKDLFELWGAVQIAMLLRRIAAVAFAFGFARMVGAGGPNGTPGTPNAPAPPGGGGFGFGALLGRLLRFAPLAVASSILLTPGQAGDPNEDEIVRQQRLRAESGEDLSAGQGVPADNAAGERGERSEERRRALDNARQTSANMADHYGLAPGWDTPGHSLADMVDEQRRTTAEIRRLSDQWMQQNFGANLAQTENAMGIGTGAGGIGFGAGAAGTPVQASKAAKEAYDYYISQGFTPEGAAGLVANEQQESGGDPNRVGDNGTAKGLYQWHKDRRDKILAATGIDVWNASANDQRRAFRLEGEMKLDPQWGAHYNEVLNATNAGWAGSLVSMYGERPFAAIPEAANRGANAQRILRMYGPGARGGSMLRQENNPVFTGPDSLRVHPAARPANSNTSVNINSLSISTQATDAKGIARDMKNAISNTYQSDTGLR